MVTSIKDFCRIANCIVNRVNPNCKPEDAKKVYNVMLKMPFKKRSGGNYKEQILQWFMEHPFENYFKEDVKPSLVAVDKWVVDKNVLPNLKTPWPPSYLYGYELTMYYQWKDTRYLISDNGILYDMLHHHQEKMYTSKDGDYIYYWKDNNGNTHTTEVLDMLNDTFNDLTVADEVYWKAKLGMLVGFYDGDDDLPF